MTVGQLKDYLNEMPDDTLVLFENTNDLTLTDKIGIATFVNVEYQPIKTGDEDRTTYKLHKSGSVGPRVFVKEAFVILVNVKS